MSEHDILSSGYRIVILFRNGKCVAFGEKFPNFETAKELVDAIRNGAIPVADSKKKRVEDLVVKILIFEEMTITRCVYPESEVKKGEIGFIALKEKYRLKEEL